MLRVEFVVVQARDEEVYDGYDGVDEKHTDDPPDLMLQRYVFVHDTIDNHPDFEGEYEYCERDNESKHVTAQMPVVLVYI